MLSPASSAQLATVWQKLCMDGTGAVKRMVALEDYSTPTTRNLLPQHASLHTPSRIRTGDFLRERQAS